MTRLRWVAAIVLVAAMAACDDKQPLVSAPAPSERTIDGSPSGSAAPLSPDDWPTYHKDNARTGVVQQFPVLGTPRQAWQAKLDGAVYGQPLVIGDTVYAATEHDTVYALAADTGQVRWSTHLAEPMPRSQLPCGNINPLGITSTMVYDPATGLLFALAESLGAHHTLYGLDAHTGAVRVSRTAEPPKGDLVAHQQRAALNLLDGRVYIAYGGLAGDCGHYIGSVTAVVVNGHVFTDGKRGTAYTLRPDHLGGIGGQVAQASVCQAYGGPAVDGDTVYVPCRDGVRAVRIDANGQMQVLWKAGVPARGSPVVGGRTVWVVDYDDGVLYALDQGTGAVRQQLPIGKSPHFASPTLARGKVYVGTLDGVTAVSPN
jgi:outer membrane protein assembly factor BamB